MKCPRCDKPVKANGECRGCGLYVPPQKEKTAGEHKWLFDPKCYELAEHFMTPDTPKQVLCELAQAIQDAVEDYGLPKEEDPGIQAAAETPFADNH